MATRKPAQEKPARGQRAASELDEEPDNELPVTEENFTPEDLAVADMLAELGDEGVMVRIYRQGKNGYRDLTLIDEVDISAFSPIMLKHPPYGGGVFRIHARAPGAGGLRVNREIRVEPAPVVATVAPVAAAPTTAELIAMMAENNRQLIAGLAGVMKPADTMGQLKDVVAVLSPLMRPAPAATGGGIAETLSLLATAKNLFEKPDAPPADSTTMERLLLKGVDVFTNIQAQQQAEKPAQPGQAQLPAPIDTPPALTEEQEEEMILVRLAVKQCIRSAEGKENARQFAEEYYDDIPDSMLQSLCISPTWFDDIAAAFPAIAPHREWLELARMRLMEMAKEDNLPFMAGIDITPPKGEVIKETADNGASTALPAGNDGTGKSA